nr:tripartite motif-containing protein 59 isoform X1 [Misgurnus anguillicaudatus]
MKREIGLVETVALHACASRVAVERLQFVTEKLLLSLMMDNLEEDLTCSVCYGLFSDPRVLPCSHTFCKSCLDSVLQVSVNFSIWRPLRLPLKCPNCRSVAELPTDGVDALPVNVCLRAIVEKYQRDGRPRSPLCPEHPHQPLNVYCVQDRKLICGFCLTVGQHRGHAIDDLQTAYVKERAAQAQLLKCLRGDRWEEICSLAADLQQEKIQSESLVQKDREVVSRFFQGLELILAQKREEFGRALDGASEQLTHTYDPLIERLKELQVEHSKLISLSSSIEDEERPLVYLEKAHELRERLKVLNESVLPEIPCIHHTPRAEEFIEEHWTHVTIRGLRDGPIPEISCRAHRHSISSCTKSEQNQCRHGRPSLVVLLLLILVLAVMCLTSVDGSSIGLSVSSGISSIISLSSELTHLFLDMWTHLLCMLHNINTKLCSHIMTLGENAYQHLITFFKTLHLC